MSHALLRALQAATGNYVERIVVATSHVPERGQASVLCDCDAFWALHHHKPIPVTSAKTRTLLCKEYLAAVTIAEPWEMVAWREYGRWADARAGESQARAA